MQRKNVSVRNGEGPDVKGRFAKEGEQGERVKELCAKGIAGRPLCRPQKDTHDSQRHKIWSYWGGES